MRIFYIFLFVICSYANASPFKQLYVKIKDNNICVFTDGKHNKYNDNQTLIDVGVIDGRYGPYNTYSRIYSNLKMPIVEDNCVIINLKEFDRDLPYDIILETNTSYSERICTKKDSEGHYQLLAVKRDLEKGVYCGTNQYDYSGNNLLTKLKNLYYWVISFFN